MYRSFVQVYIYICCRDAKFKSQIRTGRVFCKVSESYADEGSFWPVTVGFLLLFRFNYNWYVWGMYNLCLLCDGIIFISIYSCTYMVL